MVHVQVTKDLYGTAIFKILHKKELLGKLIKKKLSSVKTTVKYADGSATVILLRSFSAAGTGSLVKIDECCQTPTPFSQKV